ncbi:MAG: DUF1513 domain-containing protein [Candidatus Accumulibacter phosphatis]|jgi:hypothetical protein|uniref:DUF1513 domain-containing protein n=1 Tax=Candidatus Accumulibacter contiguus TaxID=2954381 RepID=A0ABX1T2E7_9PROT|nr:DUF1513 domain-containing protein [Candidatus Accumulibacter contiguus]NMQ03805.1 DUF1513 domain-containing protein [Candidatus Accumulibacter contiguus]
MTTNRRQFIAAVAAGVAGSALPGIVLATTPRQAVVAAAWRGPNQGDPYFAGALVADWETRKLDIRHAVPLPSRPHGLLPEADGGMLVVAARPGAWLMRCDAQGKVQQQVSLEESSALRFCGHAVVAANGEVLLTTETEYGKGRGRIGVRDRRTLQKLDEWDTHGIDPHQLALDAAGQLIVANGGVPRTLADKKHDLQRMESSLVRLDTTSGKLLRQWRLDDPRLSLRHIAWSHSPVDDEAYLGIAIQAEHERSEERAQAPILAVLDGDRLFVPTRANDGIGYAGDIAAAWDGGFVLSSNQIGLAHLWHPAAGERMTPLVRMKEAYALTSWRGAGSSGGVLVATGLGLVRSHPQLKPVALPWPQPMALDNHWSLISET